MKVVSLPALSQSRGEGGIIIHERMSEKKEKRERERREGEREREKYTEVEKTEKLTTLIFSGVAK